MKEIAIAVTMLIGLTGGMSAQSATEQLKEIPQASIADTIITPVPDMAVKAADTKASVKAAGKSSLPKPCLRKVVDAVNKHHTLAEGSVYALRTIYNGEFASVLLVGHSDETDPSDYLVTVEKRGCTIKSIVYTNESIGVEEYSSSEHIENVLK